MCFECGFGKDLDFSVTTALTALLSLPNGTSDQQGSKNSQNRFIIFNPDTAFMLLTLPISSMKEQTERLNMKSLAYIRSDIAVSIPLIADCYLKFEPYPRLEGPFLSYMSCHIYFKNRQLTIECWKWQITLHEVSLEIVVARFTENW